ncbi:MAG: hypothetical protein P4L31_03365 [Candidatus Babeliales bacterium]|nr:hypothetical protein [Candidatus Babeliales bacterium]
MCFSAQASFIAATLLSTVGILSIAKARKMPMRILASSTLLFGIQQAIEGIVWLTLIHPASSLWIQQLASFCFIFFALIVWPLSVPILLCHLEKNILRKKILHFFIGAGMLSAACSLAGIYIYGIHPQIVNHHIAYSLINLGDLESYSAIYLINSILYVLALVGSMITSSISYMWLLGIIVGISLIISIANYWMTFGSVWCFFGGLSSILIYFIIQQEQKTKK